MKQAKDDRMINEAKWFYYESNFYLGEVTPYWRPKNVDISMDTLSNICFINNNLTLKVDTVIHFGDTTEINLAIWDVKRNVEFYPCCNFNGIPFLNIFGFYPNVDTISYWSNNGLNIRKRSVNREQFSDTLEKFGIYKRKKLRKIFKDFIVENKERLNPWLKSEAKKRGYIK